jgi:hypothetical protein
VLHKELQSDQAQQELVNTLVKEIKLN